MAKANQKYASCGTYLNTDGSKNMDSQACRDKKWNSRNDKEKKIK